MAEPVTNFNLTWGQSVGITASWTAAEDVTTNSYYLLYIFDQNLTYPNYMFWKKIVPFAQKVSGQAGYVLQPPSTVYLLPWSDVLNFGKNNRAPAAISMKIIHVDSTEAFSDPVSDTAYPRAVSNFIGAPHLNNYFDFDSFGQARVTPQDSYEEISDNVKMLLDTPLGSRTAVPGYGTEDVPLTTINTQMIETSIRQWETRANPVVTVTYDDDNNASLNVSIKTNN